MGNIRLNNDIVTVENLVKRFGTFAAVDGISLSVQRGQIYGFLGANGAGKTTTIRILCGLLKATSGQAIVAGIDIIKDPEAVKPRIGYMSQKFSLYEDLTVRENLEFYGGVYRLGNSVFKQQFSDVTKRLSISDIIDSLVIDLPAGWKQRLALACSILHQPEILFLDEPTSGVDPLARRAFWRLIYDLASDGTSVIVTTHYMDEAEACERIAIMHAGKIIAEGTIDELKSAENADSVQQVFISRVKSAMQQVS
ncbi:ABC transporter ATP-binding protein [bacterium SM23_57]|nr:MAG: ABC transporter ATP-binding protein [bacterium SM23_57]